MNHKHIFLSSFVLTVLIFSLGLLISYGMDFVRVNEILSVINQNKISADAYLVEQEFIDVFGGNKCSLLQQGIFGLKQEVEDSGKDLSRYGEKNVFKKDDIDYLQRRYFLSELKLFALINELNLVCRTNYSTILFFYEIDDDLSERQGYILADLEKSDPSIFVFSFDKDYDKEPLLNLLLSNYNISVAPTLVVAPGFKFEGLAYAAEIVAFLMDDKASSQSDPAYVIVKRDEA